MVQNLAAMIVLLKKTVVALRLVVACNVGFAYMHRMLFKNATRSKPMRH